LIAFNNSARVKESGGYFGKGTTGLTFLFPAIVVSEILKIPDRFFDPPPVPF
jgi:hypothetical protein